MAQASSTYGHIAQLLLSLPFLKRPKQGWIREWRKLQSISNAELSSRLRVSPARLSVLERDEARQAVTLKTMQRAADALDCEFVYALVPRQNSHTAKEFLDRLEATSPPPLALLPSPLADFLQQFAEEQPGDQIHALLGKLNAQRWHE